MDSETLAHMKIWRLVSVRLSAESSAPECYFLLHEAEHDTPLMNEGRIIFVTHPTQSMSLIQAFGSQLSADEFDVDQPLFCCDIANALYVLTSLEEDDNGTVVDTLNLLLDLTKDSPVPMPLEYKTIISDLADHFTFSCNSASFFAEETRKPEIAINAILWCIGSVMTVADFNPDIPSS